MVLFYLQIFNFVNLIFSGGRECSGILKGFDPLLNLVLDNTTEYLRDQGNKENAFRL